LIDIFLDASVEIVREHDPPPGRPGQIRRPPLVRPSRPGIAGIDRPIRDGNPPREQIEQRDQVQLPVGRAKRIAAAPRAEGLINRLEAPPDIGHAAPGSHFPGMKVIVRVRADLMALGVNATDKIFVPPNVAPQEKERSFAARRRQEIENSHRQLASGAVVQRQDDVITLHGQPLQRSSAPPTIHPGNDKIGGHRNNADSQNASPQEHRMQTPFLRSVPAARARSTRADRPFLGR
jgi:hypothetical protein